MRHHARMRERAAMTLVVLDPIDFIASLAALVPPPSRPSHPMPRRVRTKVQTPPPHRPQPSSSSRPQTPVNRTQMHSISREFPRGPVGPIRHATSNGKRACDRVGMGVRALAIEGSLPIFFRWLIWRAWPDRCCASSGCEWRRRASGSALATTALIAFSQGHVVAPQTGQNIWLFLNNSYIQQTIRVSLSKI